MVEPGPRHPTLSDAYLAADGSEIFISVFFQNLQCTKNGHLKDVSLEINEIFITAWSRDRTGSETPSSNIQPPTAPKFLFPLIFQSSQRVQKMLK